MNEVFNHIHSEKNLSTRFYIKNNVFLGGGGGGGEGGGSLNLTFISLHSLIVYPVRFNPNNKRFHLLIFPCLLKRMVLPLIMKTEKNFK